MSDLTQQQIVELFKDAPEGYDWYLPESDGFYASWIKTNKGITVSEKRVLSGNIFSFDFDFDNLVSHQGLIPKPVTVPTFTQEMCNAGTLPSVGMECCYSSSSMVIWNKCTVIAYYGGFVWTSDNGIRPLANTIFKPLSPPKTDTEKAVDLIIDQTIKEMDICFELKSNHDDSLVNDDTQLGVEFATEFMRSKLIQLLGVQS